VQIWHLTPDAPRTPLRVGPGELVRLEVGTWPIAPGQSVWAAVRIDRADGTREGRTLRARWRRNDERNSYWEIDLGRFQRGDRVRYTVLGEDAEGSIVTTEEHGFGVGPKTYLAVLWHQHQPLYADPERPGPRGSLREPWVRLHAIRDYYSMAARVLAHPRLRLTINLTPSLLRQIEAYLDAGVTDRALELTLRPAEELDAAERRELWESFFEASYDHQIRPHARYAELHAKRAALAPPSVADLRDLQMWFNLSWFHPDFLDREVELVTGETVAIHDLVDQGSGYTHADVERMVAAQYTILRAVIPVHREAMARGRVEIATSPAFHPILPLLIDSDRAVLDRPDARLPRRFAHPEDAEAQIASAVADYRRWFGRTPRGMWPSEGAVSRECIPIFARHGVRWIASDQGVLACSGKWGYATGDPDVGAQPYRVEEDGSSIAIFFRDHELSDAIGFSLQHVPDPEQAAEALLGQIRGRYVQRFASCDDRVITIVVDGENPWGAYANAGRDFLEALYRRLEADPEIETITFDDYLERHPTAGLTRLHELGTGSWIDEFGSRPGVDLGTWIGEDEENRAWEILGETRDALSAAGATPESHPAAFESLYAAEGSDWFWWYGADQDSGRDAQFDELFRARLRHVWRELGLAPPDALARSVIDSVSPDRARRTDSS
jgi:alpha-amylase/alpha-mannosidase (GH57 family)